MGKNSRDIEDARKLQKEFDEIESKWIAGEIKIKDSDGNILKAPKTPGLYRMCYGTGKKYRRQLHKYWFVSKAGNVISLEENGNPRWQKCGGGERNNQYIINKNRVNKLKRNIAISDYTLVALVYGSRIIGEAKTLLEKKGLEAIERVKHDNQGRGIITTNNKKLYAYDGVGCHHIDGYDMDAINQRGNCNPDRLVLITNRLHAFFNDYVVKEKLTFSSNNDYEKCLKEYIKQLDRKAKKEAKNILSLVKQEKMENKISVFTPTGDERGNIEEYDNLEQAKKSKNYEQIKQAYFISEAKRINDILQETGTDSIIDFPAVVAVKDEKTGDDKNEFMIFRYQRGKLPRMVNDEYDLERANILYQTWVPVFYHV